jgi:hypothetical protein
MKSLLSITSILICFALIGISPNAFAGCTVWHTECVYDCIEYYPNGTDCKKSKKRCFKVCDDFDVHPSGPTAKSKTPIGFRYTNSRQVLDEKNISCNGQLARIVSFRINDPRWLLILETPLIYGKEKIDNIEVQALGVPIEKLMGRRVTISGVIEWQAGRIGGKQPILIVKDIVELQK